MEEVKPYEECPVWIAALSVGMTLLTYALGAYILAGLAVWLIAPYLLYGLWTEWRVVRSSCVNCYYYGKRCGLGRGRLCARLFPQGDPAAFGDHDFSWVQMVAYSLTALAPMAAGVAVAIRDKTWAPIILVVIMAVVYFVGNGIVRGRFGCKYCMQGRLGCPVAANMMGPKRGATDA